MYTIGIDLGGTNIAAGIVDDNNVIIKKVSVPTLAQRGPELITKDMADITRSLMAECSVGDGELYGVGIAAPGTVNVESGIIECSFNIKCINFKLTETFSALSGISPDRIEIGNDANLAAYGEAVAGAAKDAKISVMLTLGTGVGGGVIIDGKILTGCFYGGAELGHIVIEKDGRQCSCGRKGCFEAYCSATALIQRTKERFIAEEDTLMREMCGGNVGLVGGKTAFAAMRRGDRVGREIVDEYISYLACGIADLINIFQPDIISIGGGVSNEKDNLLVPLSEKVREQIYSFDKKLKTKLAIAALGNDAGIIGAAAALRNKLAASGRIKA